MKKIKILLVLSSLSLFLFACDGKVSNSISDSIAESDLENVVKIGKFTKGYTLVRDTRTGCIYIKENHIYSSGFTAYYDEEGKVAGCGEVDLEKGKYE